MGLFSTILSFFAFIFGKDYSFTGLVEKIKVAAKTFVVGYVTKRVTALLTPTAFLETHYNTLIIACVVLGVVSVMIAGCFQHQLTSLRVRFGYQEDPAVVAARANAEYWSGIWSTTAAKCGVAALIFGAGAAAATAISGKSASKETK